MIARFEKFDPDKEHFETFRIDSEGEIYEMEALLVFLD